MGAGISRDNWGRGQGRGLCMGVLAIVCRVMREGGREAGKNKTRCGELL